MTPSRTTESFEALPWHDAEVTEVRVFRKAGDKRDTVRLAIRMYDDKAGDLRPIELDFVDCVAVKFDVNLQVKAAVHGSILEAACESSSSWITEFEKSPNYLRAGSLLHFNLRFIDPTGSLDVLAADFQIRDAAGLI